MGVGPTILVRNIGRRRSMARLRRMMCEKILGFGESRIENCLE
jgi:hypothetical protein